MFPLKFRVVPVNGKEVVAIVALGRLLKIVIRIIAWL
jgi:hypothetical protein